MALQRLGTADEVANTLLFLASDGAAYINVANIAVDGGSIQTYSDNKPAYTLSKNGGRLQASGHSNIQLS